MRALSKSNLLAHRQCHKKFWLEINRPELEADSAMTAGRYEVELQVGHLARRLFDPKGKGVIVDAQTAGIEAAFARSRELLKSTSPIFEAGFRRGRVGLCRCYAAC